MDLIKILIVEDDKRLARLLELYLVDLGYRVSAITSTGEEAVLSVKKDKPDLILMDIILKGKIDGIEAASEIKALSDIPLIYLTGRSDDTVIEKLKKTEPFGYIVKPPDPRHLKIAIEVALYKSNVEKRLKEEQKWFSSALNSIVEGVIVVDEKDNIKFINRVAGFYFNKKQDKDHSGQKLKDFLGNTAPAVMKKLLDLAADVTKSSAYKQIEGFLEISAKPNTILKLQAEASPILDDKEQFMGTVILFRCLSK